MKVDGELSPWRGLPSTVAGATPSFVSFGPTCAPPGDSSGDAWSRWARHVRGPRLLIYPWSSQPLFLFLAQRHYCDSALHQAAWNDPSVILLCFYERVRLVAPVTGHRHFHSEDASTNREYCLVPRRDRGFPSLDWLETRAE